LSKVVDITGVPSNWQVWSDDLPLGFSLVSATRKLSYDGNVEVFASSSFTLKCSMPAGETSAYSTLQNITISGGQTPISTAYRAFKLHMTAINGGNAYQLAELIIAEATAGATVLGSATMTATSTFGSDVPSNLVDGSNSSIWSASVNTTTDVIADLGATSGNWKIPKELRIVPAPSHGDRGPTNYVLSATTGDPTGSPTWTTLLTITGETSWDGTLQTAIRHIIHT
jgi:hypothetical protein